MTPPNHAPRAHRALFALACSLALASCGAPQSRDATVGLDATANADVTTAPLDARPSIPSLTATSWPEADALFHREPRWLGGDAAYSIDLGGGRSLWLFGDSFIATSARNVRSESAFVRNSIAIQTGSDPSTATMAFFWQTTASRPTSFFPERGANWLWPQAGARVGTKLVLFLTEIAQSGSGAFGFRTAAWHIVVIDDPDADPSTWTPRFITPPATMAIEMAGPGALFDGEHLYAHGFASGNATPMRWSRAAVDASDFSSPEWWMGASRGWLPHASMTGTPATTLPLAQTEFSVQWVPPVQRYLEVQTVGFGATSIGVRWSASLTGTWGSLANVFRPPEGDRPAADMVFTYAGKAHPQLSGADVVATYASNSFDFATLVRDQTLYYPRFVRMMFR